MRINFSTVKSGNHSNYLSVLEGRNGLFDGFASLFNMFGSYDSMFRFFPRRNDTENIAGDWKRVGDSICETSARLRY